MENARNSLPHVAGRALGLARRQGQRRSLDGRAHIASQLEAEILGLRTIAAAQAAPEKVVARGLNRGRAARLGLSFLGQDFLGERQPLVETTHVQQHGSEAEARSQDALAARGIRALAPIDDLLVGPPRALEVSRFEEGTPERRLRAEYVGIVGKELAKLHRDHAFGQIAGVFVVAAIDLDFSQRRDGRGEVAIAFGQRLLLHRHDPFDQGSRTLDVSQHAQGLGQVGLGPETIGVARLLRAALRSGCPGASVRVDTSSTCSWRSSARRTYPSWNSVAARFARADRSSKWSSGSMFDRTCSTFSCSSFAR